MKLLNGARLALLVLATALIASGCFDPLSYGTRAGGGSAPDIATFEADVYPILLSYCATCHADGGSASATDLVLSYDAAVDYDVIVAFVSDGDPAGSALLQKAAGTTAHGGSGILTETSVEYQTIAVWVEHGAAND